MYSPRRTHSIHSLGRHWSDHGLCYRVVKVANTARNCNKKQKSPDGHRKWDLGRGTRPQLLKPNNKSSLSWLDQMNTDSNLMYSIIFSREEKLRGLSLWIPLLLCLSTAVHTPPSTAQPHKCRLNLQIAPVKEPVERQLPFTLISFVLAKLFLIQISSVIRYYHKVLPTVAQPQPKKWQTAITVVAFLVSFVWCWRQQLIQLHKL